MDSDGDILQYESSESENDGLDGLYFDSFGNTVDSDGDVLQYEDEHDG